MSMDVYVIPIPGAVEDGACIVYRPLLGLAFIGNAAMAALAGELAQDPAHPLPDEIRAFLEGIGYLAADPVPPPAPEAGPFSPQSVALLLTNQCQLRCTYCYAAAGESPRQHLSLETGRAAIDIVYENLKRLSIPRFMVSLHGGGEPTYPWKTLQALVAYAREKPIPTDFSLTSNAIWSEQQTEWIMAYVGSVGVSMDGSPGTQDLQRPLASGRQSSPWVMRALRTMEERGYSYGIRLTAVPPFDRLVEDIRFLCENTRCQQMQVEAAFNTRRGEEGQPEMEEGLLFLQTFFAAQAVAEQYGRDLRCAGSDVNKITSAACSSPFNTLVVTPQNKVVACFEVVSDAHPLAGLATIGEITPEGLRIDEEARTRLRNKIDERRASCRDCFCYWSCAGDCLIRGFSPHPESHLQHGVRCELNRVLLREMLLKAIAAGNGLWRRTAQGQG
jgi:uncharacterized protein